MKDLISGVSIWIIFTCGILIIWNTCKKVPVLYSKKRNNGISEYLSYEIDVFFEEMKRSFKEKMMSKIGKIQNTEYFRDSSAGIGEIQKEAPSYNYSNEKEIPYDEEKDLITNVDKMLYSKPGYYNEEEARKVLDRVDSSNANTKGLFPTKSGLKDYNDEGGEESRFKNIEYTDNVEFLKKNGDISSMDPEYGSWKPLDYFDSNMFSL